MSLTSHLEDGTSPIGQFIRQGSAHSAKLRKEAKRQMSSVTTLRPDAAIQGYPFSTIDIALRYRIRYSFAITPYRNLIAWKGAMLCASKRRTRDNKQEAEKDVYEALELLQDSDISHGVAQGRYPLKLIKSFFESLETTLSTLQPVGRRLELEAERKLARYCYVLALFEEVFRSGFYIMYKPSPLFVPTTKHSVKDLLAIPRTPWIDDLCAMSTLFHERYQPLLSCPHVLNPTFAGSSDVGSADADMVINGCLIEIESPLQPKLDPEYLYKLAGYLLLDYTDQLNINTLGIYMARQGMLFTWPVSEFLHQLTGDDEATLESLRQAFRGECKEYWASLSPAIAAELKWPQTHQYMLPSRIDQVRALEEQGMDRDTIIQAVWGVKRRNTAAFEEADAEYSFIRNFLRGEK